MSTQKGFAPIILILGVIVILAAGLSGYWFLKSQQKTATSIDQSVNQIKTSKNNTEFRVAGDKIYKGDELLFINVKGVKEVRLGPDKNTIHFKTDGSKDAKFCANLATKIEPLPSDYIRNNNISPPPQQVPWDYQKIGDAYTVGDCRWQAGGYLKNSDNFSYLVLDKTAKTGVFVIEKLDTGKVVKLNIDPKLLTGFFDGDYGRVNSYWADEIVGSDNRSYYYPHNDSYEVNGKLALSFARLIFAVDTSKQTFLGGFGLTQPEYNLVATSFWFHSKETVPLVVIEAGWEGANRYEALVDFSGEKIKIEKIENLDKSGVGLFDLKKITWENGGVKLNLYAEEDLSNQVIDISKDIKNYEDTRQVKAEEDKAVARLKQDKNYFDVKCIFSPGIIGGCFAALNPVAYYYKPGGPLQKI